MDTLMDAVIDNEQTVKLNDKTYFKDVSKIEEMSRILKDLKKRLNKASMQCHLLNIDVVTQFDPYQIEALKSAMYDCQKCIERIEKKEQDILSKTEGNKP